MTRFNLFRLYEKWNKEKYRDKFKKKRGLAHNILVKQKTIIPFGLGFWRILKRTAEYLFGIDLLISRD